MSVLKNKTLAIFLEPFENLELWDKVGLIERELVLYNCLAKKFKKVYFFTFGSEKDKRYQKNLADNVEIIPLKNKWKDYYCQFFIPFKFSNILKNCDVYKTNQNGGAIIPTICKLLYGNKLIIRSGYIASLNFKLFRLPLRFRIYIYFIEFFSYLLCDKAFIPMKNQYSLLIKKYPFIRNKLIQMNNFIDTELFAKREKKKIFDIIYVARFDKDKNHLLLLNAVKNSNLSLLFVGIGPEESNIFSFAKSNNMNLKIINRIKNNKLPDFYNSSKLCVFPSLHEGNPKSLLEAMSCELPVIGCDVIGVNNIIKHNTNGILCELDTIDLKNAINLVLKDKQLQKRLSRNARQYVKNSFSLNLLLKKEIEIYEKLFE